MYYFTILSVQFILVQHLANGQDLSCVYPPNCRPVEFTPPGANFSRSPFYDILLSPVDGVQEVDNGCTTFIPIKDKSLYFLYYTQVYKNGSYTVSKSLVGVVKSGVSRLEYMTGPSGCSSCVLNDITIKSLESPCEGVYFIYRCFTFGDCVAEYGGRPFWFANRAAAAPAPAADCGARVEALARAAGLASGQDPPPFPPPDRLARRCVTRVGGLVAINADLVAPRDALQL